MNFPKKIAKPAKRSSRFKSQAHLAHVRSHECANCGDKARIEAAHVRLGSRAGMGQKPDDWRCVPLCGRDGALPGCHDFQHLKGERTFWAEYANAKGHDVEALIQHMIRTSPRRAKIEAHIREMGE